jgi:hypothetical protein
VPSERLEVVRRLRDAWCRFVPDETVAFYSLDAATSSESLGQPGCALAGGGHST